MKRLTLNTSERSQAFARIADTDTGRRAWLGDPETAHVSAKPFILKAHMAVRDATDKVARLSEDATRTEAAKHAAAAKVVGKATADISAAHAALTVVANEMDASAMNKFSAYANDAAARNGDVRQAAIGRWIQEQAKTPQGMAEIQKQALTNPRVLAELELSESFILGLAPETHMRLRMDGMTQQVPDAVAELKASGAICKTLATMETFAKDMHAHLYDANIAKQGETHVEI